MYQETGFDELPLDGMHPGMYFGDGVCGENSRTEGILDNSMSTSSQTWGKPLSDSDSGESLFLTQRDTQPVRTLKRQRPEQNALNQFAAGELHSEDEESDSPDRQWETSSQPRRTRKFSQLRWRRHSHKRLSRRKSLTCELGALGGFFKCVMKMKAEGFKVSKRPRKRPCQDTRRCISPPSDFCEGEDCEDDDIKIVDLKDLIPRYKIARKGYNPWLDGNDALGTVAEEMKDSSETTPDFSDPCSESSGSNRKASSWEDECSESESESRPVRRPSSDRLSSCVTDALASCFRQDEMQQKGTRASVPETSPGVKKLRAMRKDMVKKQCVAGKRPPYTTMIQADVNEKEGRTEHLRLWDSPVMQLLDPGDGGNSQAKETGGEEGSPREATSRRDREGDNGEQRRGAIENCAGGKNKIFPVPMRTWDAWEDDETNVNLQGCVHEETVTVPDSVQVDTADGETDAVEDTVQSVTKGQPAGLLREEEQSKGTEIAGEEPVGLPSDSLPAEEGTAGCAVEPEPHTQPSRDCQHQTQVRESCSSAGERERDISIPEHVVAAFIRRRTWRGIQELVQVNVLSWSLEFQNL
ncbi:hypothetical protein COCON_G00075140 [Conger conger]|uniref:Uncharacterized protein n=1 Tax=Conger conger TaxID=82655 RepID=A0A9Q1DNE6_CONCO|nr:hypothetical protein COCON_G00075140 [Conger conger]